MTDLKRLTILCIFSTAYIYFSALLVFFFGNTIGYSGPVFLITKSLTLTSYLILVIFYSELYKSSLFNKRVRKALIIAVFANILLLVTEIRSFSPVTSIEIKIYSFIEQFVPLAYSVSLYNFFLKLEHNLNGLGMQDLKSGVQFSRVSFLAYSFYNLIYIIYFLLGRSILTDTLRTEMVALNIIYIVSVTGVFTASVKFYIELYRDVLKKRNFSSSIK